MSIIICPNCKSLLHQVDKTLRCENGHAFDLSKEGYINLLLANQKKKSNPGDNKMMANAREAFLSTGHYDFLIENIESTINSLNILPTSEDGKVDLLDLGCGTGFYTRHIFKEKNFQKVGVDISKIGVAKAAVRDKESTYIVGSAFNLPIQDAAIDLLVNIFSPLYLEELKRVLKPGAHFIKVIPTGDHMKEVAELVYEVFTPHQSSIQKDIESDLMFRIANVEKIKNVISLSGDDLRNFISMTPYLYKFKEGELEKLKALSVTISFEVIIGAKINS